MRRISLAAVAALSALAAATSAFAGVKVPEGAEVHVRIDEALSSGTATAGQRFNITLEDPIDVGGGVVIPAGYRGVGEVINAEKRGHMGKAGKLNVQLSYIKVGDQRIRLRSTAASEGKGSMGSAVALTVLFGPIGLLARGADVTIPAGKQVTAYVDSDVELTTPLPAAPKEG